MGPNGLARGHRQVSQSHSGEVTAAKFPGRSGAVCGIPELSQRSETRRRTGLIGNRAVRRQYRVDASAWTAYPPDDRDRTVKLAR